MDGKTAAAAAAGVVAMTAWVGLRPARSVTRALERWWRGAVYSRTVWAGNTPVRSTGYCYEHPAIYAAAPATLAHTRTAVHSSHTQT